MINFFTCLLLAIIALVATAKTVDWGRKQVQDLVDQYPFYQTSTNFKKTLELLGKMPAELREIFHLREIIIYQNRLYERTPSKFPGNVRVILQRLTRQTTLPDVLLIFVDRDEMPTKLIHQYSKKTGLADKETDILFRLFHEIPMFMASKDLSGPLEKTNLMLPDKYVMDAPRFDSVIQNITEGLAAYPWESRLDKAFWRGQPTGAKGYDHTTSQIIQDIPNLFTRAQLVKISKEHPDLLDARFVVVFQEETGIFDKINLTDYKSNAIFIKDHLRYKYQVSVDGYTATWERIPWILHSGCVLFKQKSPIVQWFYDRLVPGVHYVEVAHDLSDLAQKLRYYSEHDNEAKTIGKRGQQLAREYLTREAIDQEYKQILEELSKWQKLELTVAQNFILRYTVQINIFDLLENGLIFTIIKIARGIYMEYGVAMKYGVAMVMFVLLGRYLYLNFIRKLEYQNLMSKGTPGKNRDSQKDID